MIAFRKIRYLIVYGLTVVALMAGSFVLPLPPGLSTILPCMLAAMIEGQKIAQMTKEPIPRAEAWRIARIMTGLVVAVNLALMAAFFPVLSQILSAVPIWAFALVFAILMGLAFLTNRFFLTMGANAVLKAQTRVKK